MGLAGFLATHTSNIHVAQVPHVPFKKRDGTGPGEHNAWDLGELTFYMYASYLLRRLMMGTL